MVVFTNKNIDNKTNEISFYLKKYFKNLLIIIKKIPFYIHNNKTRNYNVF